MAGWDHLRHIVRPHATGVQPGVCGLTTSEITYVRSMGGGQPNGQLRWSRPRGAAYSTTSATNTPRPCSPTAIPSWRSSDSARVMVETEHE